MNENDFLLSVIIINFNNYDGLKITLKSVENQLYKNYETICIDGGSTDGSLELINSYSYLINHKIIGQDSGIYNAMNIGIQVATGRYFIFLNSGDYLYSNNVFNALNEKVDSYNQNTFFFGYSEIVSEKTKWLFPPQNITSNIHALNKWLSTYEPTHQAMFFPRHFCKNNQYNEDLKIIADKHFKRLALNHLDCIFMGIVIASFQIGGVSSHIKDFKHLRNYIMDFRYYYLENINNISNFIKFFHECLKLVIKFILQKALGTNFWHLLKVGKNY